MTFSLEDRTLSESERSLLALLRAESAEEVTAVLRALPILEELIETARDHGLTPALHHHLSSLDFQSLTGFGSLTNAVWGSLQADYWQTAARNTLIYHELEDVLAKLSARGIRILALKGVALAETVYDNVALRPMGDVDLLVPKSALQEAIVTLQISDYRVQSREQHPGFGRDYESQILLVKPMDNLALELHWHLLDSPFYTQHIPEEALWAEAVPIRIAGQQIEAFGPEATLIHLSAHWAFHHHFHHLLWLYDLDRLIRRHRDSLSWTKLLELACTWQLVLPLRSALWQSFIHLGTPIPADFRQAIEAVPTSAQERRVFSYLTSAHQDVISRFWVDFITIRGAWSKARFLWYNVFPSRNYMVERYAIPAGRPIWPYYGWRLIKGLGQAAWRAATAVLATRRR